MRFRRFLEGPGNLRIAQVVEIDENGVRTTLGYEVYEGTKCISRLVPTLAQAVRIAHRRVQQLEQVAEKPEINDPDGDDVPDGPGGP